MRAMKWFCMGLLVLGCTVGLTACSDDDDGDDDGDAAGNESAGETLVIEEDAAGDADDAPAPPVVDTGTDEDVAETDAEDDVVVVALAAPQQVAPGNGEIHNISSAKENVRFEWSAVAGAASYILEVNGNRRTVGGTTATVKLGAGVHRWRVSARDPTGAAGPASGLFLLRINSSAPIVI